MIDDGIIQDNSKIFIVVPTELHGAEIVLNVLDYVEDLDKQVIKSIRDGTPVLDKLSRDISSIKMRLRMNSHRTPNVSYFIHIYDEYDVINEEYLYTLCENYENAVRFLSKYGSILKL